MNFEDFLKHYLANSPQLMWFLGAGTSRTANMPTASDITWDLKLKYYCLQENQDIQNHDINNVAIKNKIQSYMDSKGFPELWSAEEYSFYFKLMFGNDYEAQQKYIHDQLASEKISLNIGHRVLAGLIELKKSKVIFTTNFDEVIEKAYAEVSESNLSTFHLEGSYAALDFLNAEKFPIYAKIHGDFKYKSIKNLPEDLANNDKEIQRCFLAASSRYGIVISGYSGRDENVMSMFNEAIEQNNAFPHGLFWTVTDSSNISDAVKQFINKANQKGITAHIIEVGTFDILLSKIWRQIGDKPEKINLKVRNYIDKDINIPLPNVGTNYPVLRTNALPIVECSSKCAHIDLQEAPSFLELYDSIKENKANLVITKTDKIMAWGDNAEFSKIFQAPNLISVGEYTIGDPIKEIAENTIIKSFYEEALARSLCEGKPLMIRKIRKLYYLVVDREKERDAIFQPLKMILGYNDKPAWITGRVPSTNNTFWTEAISIKLEVRNGALWLLLRPDFWISPLAERQNQVCVDFMREKRRYRYNTKSSQILDAWINILFGTVGNKESSVSCFSGSSYPISFKINTRSAYSRVGV